MRARLVESAFTVFAEKGLGASIIQEVIARAGVSHGTFYNYFRTNDELLTAVAEDLSNELVSFIEQEVNKHEDPAVRIATGLRLYLHKARAFPPFARFIVRSGLHLASPNHLIYEHVPRHLEAGMASGRFHHLPVEVALDLISGLALTVIGRLAGGETAQDYVEQVVTTMLHALGVPQDEADAIAFAPLERLPVDEDSLLARATSRAVTHPRTGHP